MYYALNLNTAQKAVVQKMATEQNTSVSDIIETAVAQFAVKQIGTEAEAAFNCCAKTP